MSVAQRAYTVTPRPAPRARPDRHRIFVAITTAPHVREAAGRAREMFAAHRDRFRWVSLEHLHLTLRFFADVSEAELARVIEAAQDAAASEAPFAITFAGLGAFPSLASPRVLWIGVTEGVRQLTDLAATLDRTLGARRFPRDDRPFTPHLTLGRVRGQARPPDLRSMNETLRGVVLGAQAVADVLVVESVLGASGPAHTVVATERLGGSPA